MTGACVMYHCKSTKQLCCYQGPTSLGKLALRVSCLAGQGVDPSSHCAGFSFSLPRKHSQRQAVGGLCSQQACTYKVGWEPGAWSLSAGGLGPFRLPRAFRGERPPSSQPTLAFRAHQGPKKASLLRATRPGHRSPKQGCLGSRVMLACLLRQKKICISEHPCCLLSE